MSLAPGRLPTCDVVIVNWNAGEQLARCLEALATSRADSFRFGRVVVVDNASTDGSVAAAGRIGADLPLSVLLNAENKGFAAASNQGARCGKAEFLLFLNPDVRVDADAVSRAMAFFQTPSARDVGIVGIRLDDASGAASRCACRFPTPGLFFRELLGLHYLFPRRFPGHVLLDWPHDENRSVDHVLGAFYLVRRDVFDQLGGFDERFFVYKEDLDFSLRAWSAGWNCYYLADARAFHRGGGSSEQIKALRLFYGLRSRVQYGYKHFRWIDATGLLLATLFLEPIARLARTGMLRSGEMLWETLGGIGRLWLWTARQIGKKALPERKGSLA